MTINTYDNMGRIVAQSGAPDFALAGAPRHTTYSAYNRRGQLLRQWGDATYPVAYAYNTYGEQTVMRTFRNPSQNFTTATWPLADDGTDATNPDPANWTTGDKTTWAFDVPSGLLAAKTDADTRSVGYTYDSRGQLTTRLWARGVRTDYSYDLATAEQRDITYSDGTPELHYTYNRLAQATQIDDATGTHILAHCICGKVASERFDPFFYGNRLLTYTLNTSPGSGPLGRTLGFGLTTASNATEQSVSYGYDAFEHFHTVVASTPAVPAASHTFTYDYVPNSNLVSRLSVDGGTTFAIDREFEPQRDVLTSIDAKWGSGTGASRARYDYLTDALWQRTSVKQSGSAFADYYDSGASNNGTFQSFAHDARGQLTAAPTYLGAAAIPGQELQSRQHQFAYDQIGNRAWSNRTGTGDSADADHYTANSLNQYSARENRRVSVSGTADVTAKVVVTQPTTPLSATLVAALRRGRYWSDELTVPNGPAAPWRGPLSLHFGKAGAGTAGADLVRLDSRMAQIPATPQAMVYDLDGNLTNDGIWSYAWDAENRLIQMTTVAATATGFPQITLKFRYDYLGRRVEKLVIDTVSNQLLSGRRYLYDGWNLITEYALNSSLSALTPVRSYTWGLDIARTLSKAGGVGALLQIADHPSGKTYSPCYDGNGNVTALVNSSTGVVAAAYEYSPFGEQLRADAPDSVVADQPFRFSTKYTDGETGLVYFGKRYYVPTQGRFLGRDPKGEKGGTHLYAYTRNNPANRWDYLGMVEMMAAVSTGRSRRTTVRGDDDCLYEVREEEVSDVSGYGGPVADDWVESGRVKISCPDNGKYMEAELLGGGGGGAQSPKMKNPKEKREDDCEKMKKAFAQGASSLDQVALRIALEGRIGSHGGSSGDMNHLVDDLLLMGSKGGAMGQSLLNKVLSDGLLVDWQQSMFSPDGLTGSGVGAGMGGQVRLMAGNAFYGTGVATHPDNAGVPSWIIIGHELGHVFLGFGDGNDGNANSTLVENPLRVSAGLNPRTTYADKDVPQTSDDAAYRKRVLDFEGIYRCP